MEEMKKIYQIAKEKLYCNIGEKIKIVVMGASTILILACVITALVFLVNGITEGYEPSVWIGLGILIGGPLLFWILSFFTYGFGEMISHLEAIKKSLDK